MPRLDDDATGAAGGVVHAVYDLGKTAFTLGKGVYTGLTADPYTDNTDARELLTAVVSGAGTAVAHPVRTGAEITRRIKRTLTEGTPGDIAYLATSTAMNFGPPALGFLGDAAIVGETTAVFESTEAAANVGLLGNESRLAANDNLRAANDNGLGGDTCVGERCRSAGQCFVAGTLVDTADGMRPIESLHEGDRIHSKDPTTGGMAYQPVLRTIVTERRALDEVTIVSPFGIESIRATPNHPFFVPGRGWTETSQLVPGKDDLETDTEQSARVQSARSLAEGATAYNLEVARFHTYFVGHSRILVHNQNASACPPPTHRVFRMIVWQSCWTTSKTGRVRRA